MKTIFGAILLAATAFAPHAHADAFQAAAKQTSRLDGCHQAAAMVSAYQLSSAGLAGPGAKQLAEVVDQGKLEDLKQFVLMAQQAKLSPTVSAAAFLNFCQNREADPKIRNELSALQQCNSEAWRKNKADTEPSDVKSSIGCVGTFFSDRKG